MQKRSIETQNKILASALVSFSNKGYDETSVSEICEGAGVSKGAFYHHFESKQAVFLVILQNWLNSIDNLLETNRFEAKTIPEAFDSMSEVMGSVLEQASGRLPMFLEFWTKASHDQVVWASVIEPYRRYQHYFSTLIRDGIAEGSIRRIDPEITATALVSMALGLLLQALLDPSNRDWRMTTRQSIKLFLLGVETG